MPHTEVEAELFSVIVHCTEEERPWDEVYRLACERDALRGPGIPQTKWGSLLPRLQELVLKMRDTPHDITREEVVLWEAFVECAPQEVPDAEIDEVVYPMYVQDRLRAYRARHTTAPAA